LGEPEVEREIVGDTDDVAGEVANMLEMVTRAGTIFVNVTGQQQPTARYLEKQRTTRIIAAESLLREELAKPNPSLLSIAAFRKVAYGDEKGGEAESSVGRMVVWGDSGEREKIALPASVTPTESSLHIEGEEAVVGTETTVGDEGGIVLSDDDAMSIGDSEEDEAGTDGFSGVSGSSSCGESIVSRTSRKRMAEESPEQEPAGTSQKKFPGAVTRSEGKCRIY